MLFWRQMRVENFDSDLVWLGQKMMCKIRWIRAVSKQIVAIKGKVFVCEFLTMLSYPFHLE